jgi:hypothetical protein
MSCLGQRPGIVTTPNGLLIPSTQNHNSEPPELLSLNIGRNGSYRAMKVIYYGIVTGQKERLCYYLLPLLLLAKCSSTHLENTVETLLPFDGILPESRYGRILDRILNLLPATTQCCDLSLLDELCFCSRTRLIYNGFLDVDDVGECEIVRSHGNFLRLRIHV